MEEIFNKLIANKLSPNTFYVLHSMSQKIKPNSFVNSSIEVKRLQIDNWLDENLVLTSKSIIFIQEIDSYFRKSKKKTTKDLLGSDYSDMITNYLELFPSIKLPSGKYARGNKKNLEINFKWFFENYEYSWDTILKATDNYVQERQREGYKYMRTAQYFIRKQNSDAISDLANYCEMIESGTDYEVRHFSEKVV
jgi:hypothetical protein